MTTLTDPRGSNLTIGEIAVQAEDCINTAGWGIKDYDMFIGYMSQYITDAHIFTEKHWNYAVLKCNALKNGFKFK